MQDAPVNKEQLVPDSLPLVVFKVIDSPSTFSLWQLGEESLVVGILAGLLDDDFGVV